jgi:hypothetical protein
MMGYSWQGPDAFWPYVFFDDIGIRRYISPVKTEQNALVIGHFVGVPPLVIRARHCCIVNMSSRTLNFDAIPYIEIIQGAMPLAVSVCFFHGDLLRDCLPFSPLAMEGRVWGSNLGRNNGEHIAKL